jgi:hypothetical protein
MRIHLVLFFYLCFFVGFAQQPDFSLVGFATQNEEQLVGKVALKCMFLHMPI